MARCEGEKTPHRQEQTLCDRDAAMPSEHGDPVFVLVLQDLELTVPL